MKVRSVTCFFDPRSSQAYRHLDALSALARDAVTLYGSGGIEVQTTRLATVPFPLLYPTEDLHAPCAWRRPWKKMPPTAVLPIFRSARPCRLPCQLRPGRPHPARHQERVPQRHDRHPAGGLSLPAARACAAHHRPAAALEPDGFTNLRFAALANLAPHGPFFPGAYHAGERPAFALAVECADLAVDAFRKAPRWQTPAKAGHRSGRRGHRPHRRAPSTSARNTTSTSTASISRPRPSRRIGARWAQRSSSSACPRWV